ncbi:aldehyde dehydrogenase family protein [Actinoplanes sp. NPDC049265]|uniref:aldehyde dehydrogenase family protein n=1 Tax=Actinoplanes sp. NPDC049265 TaxID=3363902 RepID=UPI003710C913
MLLKPGTDWPTVYARCREVAPEAFQPGGLANFWGGLWRIGGATTPGVSPVDGAEIAGAPAVDQLTATAAVRAAYDQHRPWGDTPLSVRKQRVAAALDALGEHRELLALLLVWEIGKPWRLATADVDRCIDGVRWYVEEIDPMLAGRTPLPGPVTNIASWNYPMSVLMHAMLVQVLAGNAAIGKAPTDGGVSCLTLAVALAAREGLPLTLISGSGAKLSSVLVGAPEVGCVSFVGGRDVGGQVAARLVDSDKRHVLEQEGLNCWGVWEFSQWELLSGLVRRSFEYGKQRCTAYPRYVVQRRLFDAFLAAYLPAIREVRFGHPLAVSSVEDQLPDLEYGPLINHAKAKELNDVVSEAIARGGVPLHRGSLADGRFLPGQPTDAYLPPVALLAPPRSSPLHHAEPFGPVDTIVLVDTEAELLAGMNASNGSLVASLACDDPVLAARLAADVQAFKVGVNRPRSRGDREEVFGGRGASWRGAFVGGPLLVHAMTTGDEPLYGNFPSSARFPSDV